MAEVMVDEQSDGRFVVTVTDGPVRTTHTVSVPAGLPGRLGAALVPVAELVRCSFTFLLEREPPTSILRTFSLDQIGDYFPDYPEKIGRLVASDVGEDPSSA
ncbi:MAG TPA: hypothetical protein VN799_07365 [Acidimicrobiales bacterium]|nr:hypothetical protein [Acidimicrobiales bacterium]